MYKPEKCSAFDQFDPAYEIIWSTELKSFFFFCFILGAYNLSHRIWPEASLQTNYSPKMVIKTQPRGTSNLAGTAAKSIHPTQDWRRPAGWSSETHASVHKLYALPAPHKTRIFATRFLRSWRNLRFWCFHGTGVSKANSRPTDGSWKREVCVLAAWRVACQDIAPRAAHEAFWTIRICGESHGP